MIVGIVPARKGSSLKDKNIRALGGHPLLAWAIACSELCKEVDKTILTTDSTDYMAIGSVYGSEGVLRPKEIAGDTAGDYSYVKHVYDFCPFDYAVILRPTTPLRDAVKVDEAIESFIGSSFVSLRSGYQLSESAYKNFKLPHKSDSWLPVMNTWVYHDMPRQGVPDTYSANGYVDIVKGEMVKNGGLYGMKIKSFITENVGEVDTEEDFDYIEYRLKKYGSPLLKYLEGRK